MVMVIISGCSMLFGSVGILVMYKHIMNDLKEKKKLFEKNSRKLDEITKVIV